MHTLGRRHVAVALSLAAIVAAGCGSSSSSKSTAATTPAAASTPGTPSTPSTSGTASTPTGAGKVTASTPISDPAARALLTQASAARVGNHLTHPQLTQLIDCTIKKFEAAGIQTVGQLGGRRTQASVYSSQCLKELNITPK